jgi:pyruvate kinase
MLESMIKAPRPTRAEASDVANAVLDGTDCVMLSGETANGLYPINAVSIMANTCCEAERCFDNRRVCSEMKSLTKRPVSIAEDVASECVAVAHDLKADCIVLLTENGNIARFVAKYRPIAPIIAGCIDIKVIKALQVVRGITGFKIPTFVGTDNVLQLVIKEAKERGLCKSGSKVVCIHSSNEDTPDESNIMKIVEVK